MLQRTTNVAILYISRHTASCNQNYDKLLHHKETQETLMRPGDHERWTNATSLSYIKSVHLTFLVLYIFLSLHNTNKAALRTSELEVKPAQLKLKLCVVNGLSR
jgi:hypothetical protein